MINWAFITGASSGLGREFALELAKKGHNLFLVARREDRLKELQKEAQDTYGVKVEYFKADLTNQKDLKNATEKAVSLGHVDILINNAGMGVFHPFPGSSLEGQMKMFYLNMESVTRLTHFFINHMLEHKRPSKILQVASLASYVWLPNFSIYNGTKSYLRAFSESLAYELRGTNMTLTCLCPGGIQTEFMANAGQNLSSTANIFMASANKIALKGLKAMDKGRTLCIPGIENKIAAFLTLFIPSRWQLALIGPIMRRVIKVVGPENK
jgi:short-subunit dehydrogenase